LRGRRKPFLLRKKRGGISIAETKNRPMSFSESEGKGAKATKRRGGRGCNERAGGVPGGKTSL